MFEAHLTRRRILSLTAAAVTTGFLAEPSSAAAASDEAI
jgi:hypothetical protein